LENNLRDLDALDDFELIMGVDTLNKNDPYLDAAHKSEEKFQLDHIHKYMIVCNTYEVVNSVVKDGFKTFVITRGKELTPEFELKAWVKRESLNDFFTYFVDKRVLFE